MKNSTKIMTGLFVIYSQFMTTQIRQDKVNIEKKDTTEVANMSRYNYFPNLQAYYDNKTNLYIYKVKDIWVHNTLIPPNYKGYGLRNGFHVVIDNYSGDEPYSLLTIHKLKYPADYSTKRKRIVVIATE